MTPEITASCQICQATPNPSSDYSYYPQEESALCIYGHMFAPDACEKTRSSKRSTSSYVRNILFVSTKLFDFDVGLLCVFIPV
jgi:hypothetical protein